MSSNRVRIRGLGGNSVVTVARTALVGSLLTGIAGCGGGSEPVGKASDAQVSSYLEQTTAFTSRFGAPGETKCAARTLGTDPTHVYALVVCKGPQDAQIEEGVAFALDPAGKIVGYQEPRDGDYANSIHKAFPSKVAKKLIDRSYDAAPLRKAVGLT